MTEIDYTRLEQRLGRQHLARRLKIQSHHVAHLFGAGRHRVQIEKIRALHNLLRRALKLSGLYRFGHQNALRLRSEHNEVHFPDLPPAFDGFRILHISDPHIDGNPDLLPILQDAVYRLQYDLCVLTGDFREGTFEDYERPVHGIAQLNQTLTAPAYAVLGNHDAIEMVPLLEEKGVQLLLNERVELRRGDQSIHLLGIDDPYFYETDHLEKALGGLPDNAFSILLAHSPEISRKAAWSGVNFYLCGHTHGGQVCLPGGVPLLSYSRCPPAQRRGAWVCENMRGYTSRGAGTSSLDIRFNCPPEITIHTLRCGAQKRA